jgi:formylglycine-generating enzyme required for sulfatase activity
LPNAWNLFDVIGNVWEWVSDWYDEAYYADSPATDPTGPDDGVTKVFRGSGWGSHDPDEPGDEGHLHHMSTSDRDVESPERACWHTGVRCVKEP